MARDEEELVSWAHQVFKESRDYSTEWRTLARESFDFDAGKQWQDEDLSLLEDQQRTAVVFNRISRTINAVVGTEINNRQEVRYIPREGGDVQVNEILSGAAEWARDNCDAGDEETDAFSDLTICGMGWTETRMDYESDLDGKIVIERVDPLEMYWDPAARKKNLSDARWVMRIKQFDVDEVENMFPGADIIPDTAPWDLVDDDVNRTDHTYPQDAYEETQRSGYRGRNRVRLAHVQWYEYDDVHRVDMGGGNLREIPDDVFSRIKDQLDERGIKHVTQKERKVYFAFIGGGEVLDSDVGPYPRGFSLRAMTGKRDRNENRWFGLVQDMKDPQRFGNKFFSQILDIINKNSKGGIMMERDAVDDPRQVEEKWARSDSIIFMNPGAIQNTKLMPKPQLQVPNALSELMAFSLEAVHDVTGVSLEMLGMANRDQPGVLEHARKQSGLTILAHLFDALKKYRKEQGRVLLYFIQEYISDGRLIRITGTNGDEQFVPLVGQEGQAEYDVIVDEAPTSPNQRERVFAVLTELLPTLGRMDIPLPKELLDYAPIPSGLAQKWKKQLDEGQQIPPQIQQQMQKMQVELQKSQQEIQQLKLKKEEAMLQLEMKREEALADDEIDRVKVLRDSEAEQTKIQQNFALKEAELVNNAQLKEAQMTREMELKEAEVRADYDLKMRELQAKVALDAATAAGDDGSGNAAVRRAMRLLNGEKSTQRINFKRDADGLLISADIEEVLEDALEDAMETVGNA